MSWEGAMDAMDAILEGQRAKKWHVWSEWGMSIGFVDAEDKATAASKAVRKGWHKSASFSLEHITEAKRLGDAWL
jgi:hypothetical protein